MFNIQLFFYIPLHVSICRDHHQVVYEYVPYANKNNRVLNNLLVVYNQSVCSAAETIIVEWVVEVVRWTGIFQGFLSSIWETSVG
jgi:hypothetical protein